MIIGCFASSKGKKGKGSMLRRKMGILLLVIIAAVRKVTPVEPPSQFCQDRFGPMDVDGFIHRSCTLCYTYLFLQTKELVPWKDYQWLISKNVSNAALRNPIAPDARNESTLELVCSTLNNDECERWRDCCHTSMQCCEEQRRTPFPETDTGKCLRTWDGFSCWGDTLADTQPVTQCPSYLEHSLTTRQASKQCTQNGTWFKKESMEWTDYRACLDKQGYLISVYIAVGCNCGSFLLLLPAVVIFCVFRGLYSQHRVRLHINFFVSLALTCVANILWYMLVHHDLLVSPVSTETVLYVNPAWCRLLSFFKIYLTSTNYFWAFCEGFYLHRLISKAFEPPKTLVPLYLIGWGVPLVPILIYAVARVLLDNESCWAKSYGDYQWIIYGPNLVCIVTNLLFLCNILRILLFQLHSHPHEPSNFRMRNKKGKIVEISGSKRRGLKAAFMLIPLFGIQLFLTIYRLPPGSPGEKEYEYITFVITSSQGVFVSLIFCFFNGEVLAQVQSVCPFCTCLKTGKRRTSTQMTMVTVADNGRSPTNSLHSRNSCCRNSENCKFTEHDTEHSLLQKEVSNGSIRNLNGSSPAHKGYNRVPTHGQM